MRAGSDQLSIIVTNLSSDFFSDLSKKEQFERVFREFDMLATFQYLSSFRRVRVNFRTADAAENARQCVNDREIVGCHVNCYHIQVRCGSVDGLADRDGYLHPPLREKNYLVSPPSSPPDDWLQAMEARPAVDESDLLAAMARLTPGEHEIHSGSSEDSHPNIVLHVAEGAAPSASRRQ